MAQPARKHWIAATFMAKSYGGLSGSGFHELFSLANEHGVNAFDDGGEAGTPLMRHAVAGLLVSMAENTLAFVPHNNAFKWLTLSEGVFRSRRAWVRDVIHGRSDLSESKAGFGSVASL